MDEKKPFPLSGDVILLKEYHQRLSNLLDRMERLEESLKAIPLVRDRFPNAKKNEDEMEVKPIEDHELDELAQDDEFLKKEDKKDKTKEKSEKGADKTVIAFL